MASRANSIAVVESRSTLVQEVEAYEKLQARRERLQRELMEIDQQLYSSSKLIRNAMAGDVYLSLSAREQQVLDLVHQKKQNKEIGDVLGISVRTVKFHIGSLLRKYRVLDRHEL